MGADIIDHLLGVSPGSRMDAIRAHRPVAREHAQKSHEVLFAPADPGGFPVRERLAVAAYVAALHGEAATAGFYAARLAEAAPELSGPVAEAAAATRATGPYGRYPAGPLSAEDQPGPPSILPAPLAEALGPRLASALAHAHLLVFHPRDAAPSAFDPLIATGWTTTQIVTLSQIVSFLAFQIRVVAGLGVLARTP